MARQWPSGLHGARAELPSSHRQTAIGLKAAMDGGTRRLGGHFCSMMYARIATAAVGMAATVLVGVGLGGYTAGGFHVREPVDVISDATVRIRKEHFSPDSATQAPVDHVCTGCDAKLHRENDWYTANSAYDTDDEWAREEGENRDVVRVALADEPPSEHRERAADGEADVVVDNDLVMYAGTAVARLDQ
jgi:hypothetical protein